MSKHYTDDHKTAVLALLQANGGNIELTSSQTNIPERTLRMWRQQQPHQPPPESAQRQPQPQPPPNKIFWRHERAEEMQQLSHQLMRRASVLLSALESETDDVVATRRIMALTRLVDRLIKLDKAYPLPFNRKHFKLESQLSDEPFDTSDILHKLDEDKL